MRNETAIREAEIALGETVKLVLCLKNWEGKVYIDARKWKKAVAGDIFYPSTLGIMLETKHWLYAIPKIKEFIDNPIATPHE